MHTNTLFYSTLKLLGGDTGAQGARLARCLLCSADRGHFKTDRCTFPTCKSLSGRVNHYWNLCQCFSLHASRRCML